MDISGGKKVDDYIIRPYRSEDDVRFVISGQLELYETEFGFNTPAWIAYVTDGVHELVNQFDDRKDCLYILEYAGVPSGSVAIAHQDDGTAKLRFLFLKPETRGQGAGSALVEMAVDFCRRSSYKHIFLWTFSTLDAARHIYSSTGFRLTQTQTNDTWGSAVLLEERWDLDL